MDLPRPRVGAGERVAGYADAVGAVVHQEMVVAPLVDPHAAPAHPPAQRDIHAVRLIGQITRLTWGPRRRPLAG